MEKEAKGPRQQAYRVLDGSRPLREAALRVHMGSRNGIREGKEVQLHVALTLLGLGIGLFLSGAFVLANEGVAGGGLVLMLGGVVWFWLLNKT